MELLVRIRDKEHDDPYVLQTHPRRGDVIVACPDGWTWGLEEEFNNPEWVIFKVPDLPEREAAALTTPELGDRKLNRMLHPRAMGLDLTKLPEVGDGRKRLVQTLTLTAAQVRTACFKKSPAVDPFVIG